MATKTVEIPTKFKTINNQEITGEGNITIEATGGMTQGASFWGGSFYQTSGSYRIYTITCSEEKRPLINDLVLDQSSGNVYKITSSSYYATATTYVRVRCSTTSSFSLKGATGSTPTIDATATVSNTTGTPSVTVTKSGTTTNPSFKFAFSGLKGEPGEGGSSEDIITIKKTNFSIYGGETTYVALPDDFSVCKIYSDYNFNLTYEGEQFQGSVRLASSTTSGTVSNLIDLSGAIYFEITIIENGGVRITIGKKVNNQISVYEEIITNSRGFKYLEFNFTFTSSNQCGGYMFYV